MNKTTEALKLAEEALEELHYSSGTVKAVTLYKSALAAIREALAEQSMVMILNDPHPPHRLCECTACLEYWTPLPDCDAFAASGKVIAEPVKQEPVGVFANVNALTPEKGTRWEQMVDSAYDGVKYIHLYAAPVERQWVDLTDDEIVSEFNKSRNNFDYASAVIAAFNEKNK